MGNKLSICCNDSCSNSWRSSHSQEQQELIHLTGMVKMSIEPLLMPGWWKERDVIYQKISAVREKVEEKDLGKILRIIAKFVPCQSKSCKCRGWRYDGIMQDSYGWKDNICIKSGCKHPLSNHMTHLVNATMTEFTTLLRLVFDTINIKGTLENVSKKSKALRNIVLEEVFYSLYRESRNCLRLGSFMSFNVNKIYGTPPFEKMSIDQILMNFCMYKLSNNNSELKNSLIITKFILRYFDTWVWITPKELLNFNSCHYSKSYHYYYQRYMVFCCLPRLIHSISDRYKMSMIFGQEVLKYTLPVFRMQLQDWCTKESLTWLNHTKLFCLERLPKYLDLLESEIYTNRSPIWNMHYKLSDFKNKIGDFGLNRNNEDWPKKC